MTEDQLFDELYDSLSTREKWKMVNRLYKRDEIVATKVYPQLEEARKLGLYWQAEAEMLADSLEESTREFRILEGACDFWKQEAIDRGYEE